MTVYYTKAAEQALDASARYTLQEWGERQRDRYVALLEDACERSVPALAHLWRDPCHIDQSYACCAANDM